MADTLSFSLKCEKIATKLKVLNKVNVNVCIFISRIQVKLE